MDIMTQEQFEAYAKRIADGMLGHKTDGLDFQTRGYQKHNGQIYFRLGKGSRSKTIAMIKNIMTKSLINNPLDQLPEEDHELFVEHVLSYLMGDGIEVEWISE